MQCASLLHFLWRRNFAAISERKSPREPLLDQSGRLPGMMRSSARHTNPSTTPNGCRSCHRSRSSLGFNCPTSCASPPELSAYQPTSSGSLLSEYRKPWLPGPPLAAYSHSASVGNRLYSFRTYETVLELEPNLSDIHKDTLLVSLDQVNDADERCCRRPPNPAVHH